MRADPAPAAGLLVDAFVARAKAGQDLVADGAGDVGEGVDALEIVEDVEGCGDVLRVR